MPRHIEQPAPRHSAPASLKIDVEALLLGLQAHPHGAGHDQHPGVLGDVVALDDRGREPEVLDPAVGAGADEDGVDLDLAHRRTGLEAHVARAPSRRRSCRAARRSPRGSGRSPPSGDALAGVGAPGDERRHRRGVEHDLLVVLGVVVGDQGLPVRDRGVPVGALRRLGPALDVVEGRLVGGDQAGLRAPLDRHVADRHPAPPSRAPRWPGRGTRRCSPARRRCRCGRSA